jgi:hypothetical protein
VPAGSIIEVADCQLETAILSLASWRQGIEKTRETHFTACRKAAEHQASPGVKRASGKAHSKQRIQRKPSVSQSQFPTSKVRFLFAIDRDLVIEI